MVKSHSTKRTRTITRQYVTKRILEGLRKREARQGWKFSWALSDDYMKRLDATLRLPVAMAFSHDDVTRTVITMPKNGRSRGSRGLTQRIVDMPHDVYEHLPSLTLAA